MSKQDRDPSGQALHRFSPTPCPALPRLLLAHTWDRSSHGWHAVLGQAPLSYGQAREEARFTKVTGSLVTWAKFTQDTHLFGQVSYPKAF